MALVLVTSGYKSQVSNALYYFTGSNTHQMVPVAIIQALEE